MDHLAFSWCWLLVLGQVVGWRFGAVALFIFIYWWFAVGESVSVSTSSCRLVFWSDGQICVVTNYLKLLKLTNTVEWLAWNKEANSEWWGNNLWEKQVFWQSNGVNENQMVEGLLREFVGSFRNVILLNNLKTVGLHFPGQNLVDHFW